MKVMLVNTVWILSVLMMSGLINTKDCDKSILECAVDSP